MFPEENSATSFLLLQGIEKAILNNIKSGGSLKDFKFLSIGYPKQINAYPYLTVLPVNEKILRHYTGNFVDILKTFRFIITTARLDQKASYGQSTGLANNLKTLFSRKGLSTFWEIKNPQTGNILALDARVGEIQVSDPMSIGTDIYIKTSLDISLLTRDKTDGLTIQRPGDELKETNLKELTKIIFETLEDYKSTLLKNVRSLKYGAQSDTNFEALPSPLVYISLDTGEIISRFAGVDLFTSTININCITDVFTNQASIYQNVDIIEKIRKIMFANRYLLNRCFNSRIGDINYGLQEGEDLRYYSQLSISTSSYEPVN